MTPDQVKAACDNYADRLYRMGYVARRHIPSEALDRDAMLRHLLWMINGIKTFIDADQIEKAMRWFGFCQGVLWSSYVYSIDEMREHNR